VQLSSVEAAFVDCRSFTLPSVAPIKDRGRSQLLLEGRIRTVPFHVILRWLVT
jgi:hypothetical protein